MRTLYFSPGSCSLAPRIILEEIGAPYHLELISVAKGEQHSPSFLRINPRGRVPVLVEDGKTFVETVAILVHLAQSAPDSDLLPSSLTERTECLSVMSWLSNTVQPTFSRFFRPERVCEDEASHPQVKAAAKKACWENLSEIDALLDNKPWICEAFSIADPMALVYYAWGKRIGLDVGGLPSYTQLKDSLLSRPSVEKVLGSENSILLQH